MTLVSERDFPAIVDLYNREGRKKTYEYIRTTYSVKTPRVVLKRIERISGYKYDKGSDKYVKKDSSTGEELFMSLDDLCSTAPNTDNAHEISNVVTMEKLVHDLISDRLLELSRYVSLEVSSRTIVIDRTSMTKDGYKVVTH